MLQITVHMCFTAREQAVRRRRPASYSSHSVDRRLWRRVYFFRCNREVPASDSRWTDTNVYEYGFLVEKVQQLIQVQPTMVGSAVETHVPTLDVVVRSHWLFERRPRKGRPHGAVHPGALDVIQVLRHPVIAVIIIVG